MHRQVSQTTKHQLRIDQHSLRRGYLAPGTGVGGWVVGDLLLPMLRLPARTPHAPTSRLLEEWRCKSLTREISNLSLTLLTTPTKARLRGETAARSAHLAVTFADARGTRHRTSVGPGKRTR